MSELVRSAVLTNYAEIARSVGLDPYQMVRSVGLSQACLVERDLKIPATAVRRLLEDSAALDVMDDSEVGPEARVMAQRHFELFCRVAASLPPPRVSTSAWC